MYSKSLFPSSIIVKSDESLFCIFISEESSYITELIL